MNKKPLVERLKDKVWIYSITGNGHTQICDILLESATEIERLTRDLNDCKNELCLKCGAYTTRHKGSCDGCRWKP